MPLYAFKGYDSAGKNVSGSREAESDRAMKQLLRREGIFVTAITEAAGAGSKRSSGLAGLRFRIFQPSVDTSELAMATRQLATLVGSGIPLVQSLAALVDQVEKPYFKTVWADVRQKVNEGAGFGDALAGHSRVFSNLYVNMVRAGESSGALDVVLNRLADFTESQASLRSKLIGTMIYPVIMSLMAVAVVGFLVTYIVPKITRAFESQNAELPFLTIALIAFTDFVQSYWWVVLPILVALSYAFMQYIRSENGKPRWDRFVLNAPIFGRLMRMVAVARFSKTLATLLSSGVPLLTAFEIVKAVLQNQVLQDVVANAAVAVKEGDSIANPLRRSQEFPPMVTHMIAIGEKSGQLESMLQNVADHYEVQVDSALTAMTSVLGPLLIVVMGGVVGLIVLSIMLPIMQASNLAG